MKRMSIQRRQRYSEVLPCGKVEPGASLVTAFDYKMRMSDYRHLNAFHTFRIG